MCSEVWKEEKRKKEKVFRKDSKDKVGNNTLLKKQINTHKKRKKRKRNKNRRRNEKKI